MDELLASAGRTAGTFRAGLAKQRVAPEVDMTALHTALGGPLPTASAAPEQVIAELVAAAEPGLLATAGPRFFGFVVGGSLPAATAADVLAVGWDQCAFNAVLSPAAAVAEETAGAWLKQLLGIPASASVGFVGGGQEANTVGLACGRHAVLADAGWDVETAGLQGAPAVRIVASVERHATIDRSLRLLGFGTAAVEAVAARPDGAIDVGDLARVLASRSSAPTVVCLQAGNVNTGACDDLRSAVAVARRHGAWVHVDGAFGLWAGASRRTRGLVDGVELADSWGCDGHKWLNVPYDSGFAFCAHPQVHVASVSYVAPYLTGAGGPAYAPSDFTLASSRRARGFAVWAALRELGRGGVEELVDRTCTLARRFAAGLGDGGAEIVNHVVLNQVLVGFGTDADRVVEAVQREGTCWVGATTWRGRRLMRVSVSNWSTTEHDVDLSVAAILNAARA
jgi:glutamate/tyrosine decarboxylase-like PLP-dependent enzyme